MPKVKNIAIKGGKKGGDDKKNLVKRLAKAGEDETKDFTDLSGQLKQLGLKMKDVVSDGNCLFRSIADQLDDDQQLHMKYRKLAVEHMLYNQEEFQPFLTERIETYCKRMSKQGEWGGHFELLALSRAVNAHIVVHQYLMPRFELAHPAPDRFTRTIHLAYLDGQHYTSIRTLHGNSNQVGLQLMSHLKAAVDAGKKAGKDRELSLLERNIMIVRQQTGCTDDELIKETLESVLGDVDAAVQIIIADQYVEQEVLEMSKATAESKSHDDGEEGDNEVVEADIMKDSTDAPSNSESEVKRITEELEGVTLDDRPQPDDSKTNSATASGTGQNTQGSKPAASKPNLQGLSQREKRELKQIAKREKELERAQKRAELRRLAALQEVKAVIKSNRKDKDKKKSLDGDSDSDDGSLVDDLGAISI